ncbi:MAG: Dabb family protein [Verrucomicrobiae bacterium]|nr:Dabb family protein [Verrucomicrobiae bacterium]
MKSIHPLIALALMILLAPSVRGDEASAPFRHFVSFQFKDGTSDEKKEELVKAFLQLKNEIDVVVDLEWGTTDNIEPLNDGFTHSFLVSFKDKVVSFKDKASLATYLPHPAHEAFVAKLKPHLEKVYVFDYTAGK